MNGLNDLKNEVMKKVTVFVAILAASCSSKEPHNKFYIENNTHADITIELSCANQRIELKKGEKKYVENDEILCDLSSWNDDWVLHADPEYGYEYFTSYVGSIKTFSFVSFVNKIKYEIAGSASSVDVTMEWSDGGTRQYSNVAVPATWEFKSWGYDGFVYLSAQNNGKSGSITCNIYHRDKLFKTATSYGEYVIATVSGSIK
jgi:hypothetical protein